MEAIVQHFATELYRVALKKISEGGLLDIDQLSSDLLTSSKEQICILISGLLEQLNQELRTN